MSTVGIIGAGITGPAAALALAHDGHQVTVYEQRPRDGLHSNGLLGITERHWAALRKLGVDLSPELPDRTYREVGVGSAHSPFRFIIWTDMHNALTAAAEQAGARFMFGERAGAEAMSAQCVIDAGGVVTAAKRGLPNYYLGQTLYRGTSPLPVGEAFVTYKMPGKAGFLDIGRTPGNRAWWVLGVKRPAPAHHGTTFTDQVPAEIENCPEEYRGIVKATREIMVLPQYVWTPPHSIHDGARFTLGDANGAVRALTTSGANLGIQAGLMSPLLVDGDPCTVNMACALLLQRRAFALRLGVLLRGPEIGGTMEDPDFTRTQAMLYGGAQ